MFKLKLKNGQSTLEVTVTLIVVFILLLASTKIFVWVNELMVLRQEAYEDDPVYGRVAAGAASVEVNLREVEYPYTKLDIFGENE